jgi:two-component system, NarL family, sensor kinase
MTDRETETHASRVDRWVHLAEGREVAVEHRSLPSTARIVGRFLAGSLAALVLVVVGGIVVSRQGAKQEALDDARRTTDLIATTVVQPELSDALLTGSPAAVHRLDRVVRGRLLDDSLVRVKIWAPTGRIVYSDEPRLIGSVYPLGADEQQVLRGGGTKADVSDADEPENRYERPLAPLLEVYRPIRTPGGRTLLFETYSRYGAVNSRIGSLWLQFAPITVVALMVLALLQLPLARRMLRRLRAAQRERERLLQRAVDASNDERRRIAGALHDGVVQDLAGASFVLAGATESLRHDNGAQSLDALQRASSAVRDSIGGLRSMLVEIYPPSLRTAGLGSALRDLAAPLHGRGVAVDLDLPDDVALADVPPPIQAVVFRVAQEALRNVAKHARASSVEVRLERLPDQVVLTVRDDGVGFDPGRGTAEPSGGHLGLRVLADLAAAEGARLDLATAPGAGATLRLAAMLPGGLR